MRQIVNQVQSCYLTALLYRNLIFNELATWEAKIHGIVECYLFVPSALVTFSKVDVCVRYVAGEFFSVAM